MRIIRLLLTQSPAVAISLAALVFAVGGGAGYAATSAASGPASLTLHHLKLHGRWQGDLKFGISGGVVYLTGQVGNSNRRPAQPIATLPPGARPQRQLDLTINLGSEGGGLVQVTPDGKIVPFAFKPTADFTFVSLDGLSYPIGS